MVDLDYQTRWQIILALPCNPLIDKTLEMTKVKLAGTSKSAFTSTKQKAFDLCKQMDLVKYLVTNAAVPIWQTVRLIFANSKV